MKILFFPQNETHVDNMLPIAESLSIKHGADIDFLDAGGIYKQEVLKNADIPYNKIRVNKESEKPFYLERLRRRIELITEFKNEISGKFGNYDAFIFGNDGALQRVLIEEYRKIPSFLILDGIISDYTFSLRDIMISSEFKPYDLKDLMRRKIKLGVIRLFGILPYNYYFPSEVGSSNVSKIFVLSEYVKSILIKQGINRKKIFATGLPRYSFLDELKNEAKENKDRKTINLLMITQGYSWHDEFINDDYQHREIRKLLDFVKEFNKRELGVELNLTIRLHPRDIESNYDYVDPSYIERPKTPIYQSLKDADIILGFNSTVLVEALYLGKKVIVLSTCGQFWRFERSFVNSGCFEKVFNTEQLNDFIIKYARSSPDILINEDKLKHLFNPDSRNSTDAILKIIEDTIINRG